MSIPVLAEPANWLPAFIAWTKPLLPTGKNVLPVCLIVIIAVLVAILCFLHWPSSWPKQIMKYGQVNLGIPRLLTHEQAIKIVLAEFPVETALDAAGNRPPIHFFTTRNDKVRIRLCPDGWGQYATKKDIEVEIYLAATQRSSIPIFVTPDYEESDGSTEKTSCDSEANNPSRMLRPFQTDRLSTQSSVGTSQSKTLTVPK